MTPSCVNAGTLAAPSAWPAPSLCPSAARGGRVPNKCRRWAPGCFGICPGTSEAGGAGTSTAEDGKRAAAQIHIQALSY